MNRTLAGLALASAVFARPALAQQATEFGVDLGFSWMKAPGGGSALFQLRTPVDVRIAFHTAGSIAVEPRFTAQYLSQSGTSIYTVDPGLNFLVALPGGAYNDGGYSTVGVDLAISGGSGVTGSTVYSFNGGLGLRRPMGKAAVRAELFLGYTPKQGSAFGQGVFALGARVGFSFFN